MLPPPPKFFYDDLTCIFERKDGSFDEQGCYNPMTFVCFLLLLLRFVGDIVNSCFLLLLLGARCYLVLLFEVLVAMPRVNAV